MEKKQIRIEIGNMIDLHISQEVDEVDEVTEEEEDEVDEADRKSVV